MDSRRRRRVVAIDGPSAAGKSTVARLLAARLGFAYLDTGAMYRAVTWQALCQGVDLDDDAAVVDVARQLELRLLPGGHVLVAGHDVTMHLRTREVDARVSGVSAIPDVRRAMTEIQRRAAAAGPLVADGRDMGSVVFPDAAWKFFLSADVRERARRRAAEMAARGVTVTETEVLEEIQVRDRLDSTRQDAPLRQSPEAILIDTTSRSVEDVVEVLTRHVLDHPAGDGG